jgi:hypothetical protein
MDKKFELSFDEKQVIKKMLVEFEKTNKRNEHYIVGKMIKALNIDLEDFSNG